MRQFLTILMVLLTAETAHAQNEIPRTDRVLTREERAKMTPDSVLRSLKNGNQDFMAGTPTNWNHPAQIRDASGGQYPMAAVLSCLDSRIPVENVFNLSIGDLFVARVAGNFENAAILGSMEFASIHTGGDGVKLIVVLGHGSCGAIEHAIDRVRVGNIAEMLENIDPAIIALAGYEGEQTSGNREFVDLVTEKNIEITIADIRRRSPMLEEAEAEGRIKIVGALYDMKTGEVRFLLD